MNNSVEVEMTAKETPVDECPNCGAKGEEECHNMEWPARHVSRHKERGPDASPETEQEMPLVLQYPTESIWDALQRHHIRLSHALQENRELKELLREAVEMRNLCVRADQNSHNDAVAARYSRQADEIFYRIKAKVSAK